MKKSYFKIGLLALILASFASSAMAQDTYKPIDFNLQVKSMHLWRGYKVTNGTMSGLNVYYTSKDGNFSGGLWNGQSLDGNYTEFDYYVAYNFGSGLSLSVWDINNFSDFPGADIFDYDNETTSHFVDVTLGYQVIPELNVSWSTIVLGRDTYVDDDGSIENAYSNYIEVNGTVYDENGVNVGLFLGGAFSFADTDSHFYGSDPNIVNIGLSVGKTITLMGHDFPVGATAMWNPEQKYGAMQFSINIF